MRPSIAALKWHLCSFANRRSCVSETRTSILSFGRDRIQRMEQNRGRLDSLLISDSSSTTMKVCFFNIFPLRLSAMDSFQSYVWYCMLVRSMYIRPILQLHLRLDCLENKDMKVGVEGGGGGSLCLSPFRAKQKKGGKEVEREIERKKVGD